MKIILLLLITQVFAGFYYTEKLYNGTADFNVIFNACGDRLFSTVCTDFMLQYNQFWKYPIFNEPAWILNIQYNCAGDANYALGGCIMRNQSTVCTCDMNMPVCCFIN